MGRMVEGSGGTAGEREPSLDEEMADMGIAMDDDGAAAGGGGDGGGGGAAGGPVFDADGWEVVQPKGARKGRN